MSAVKDYNKERCDIYHQENRELYRRLRESRGENTELIIENTDLKGENADLKRKLLEEEMNRAFRTQEVEEALKNLMKVVGAQ